MLRMEATIRKNRFACFALSVRDGDEARAMAAKLRRGEKGARHFVWAFDGIRAIAENDGEVGHPANAILRVMRLNAGSGINMVAVARHFGGKMGVDGVRSAFVKCAAMLLKKAG